MRDYYISATVRNREHNPFVHLWTIRIQAHCLSDARAHAILLIEKMDCVYDELQVMWDEAEAIIAPEWNQAAESPATALK